MDLLVGGAVIPARIAHPRKALTAWRKRARLPWMRCKGCLSPLVQFDVDEASRQTCIRVGPTAVLIKGTIVCTACGTVRNFQSVSC